MSLFKQKVSFSKFRSLFSVMRDNSLLIFSWNLYAIDKNFRHPTVLMKINQISYVSSVII